MSETTVTGPVADRIENRGTDAEPYGYVYFDDRDVRVWFRRGEVFYSSGCWADPTAAHIIEAQRFLKERYGTDWTLAV